MIERAIVNSSPLIFLAKVGMIDLLKLSAPRVQLPEAVALEIMRRGPDDVTVLALQNTPWLTTVVVSTIPATILSWDLGAGESAVLAHALADPVTVAIMDDGLGRRCAESLGIPVSGTLGLVMKAKKNGLIAEARPVIALLKRHGMYLSDRTIRQALSLIGE